MQQNKKNSRNERKEERRMKKERRLSMIMAAFVGIFMFAWTPYTIVCLYMAFVDAGAISPMMTSIPAMFAKSSMLFSSLFFIFTNSQFKRRLGLNLLKKSHLAATPSASMTGANKALSVNNTNQDNTDAPLASSTV